MTDEQQRLQDEIVTHRRVLRGLLLTCEANGHVRAVIPTADALTQVVTCEVCGRHLGRRCLERSGHDRDGSCTIFTNAVGHASCQYCGRPDDGLTRQRLDLGVIER